MDMDMDSVYDIISSADFWVSSAFFIAGARVLWTLVQVGTEWLLFQVSLRTRTANFVIPAKANRPKEIKKCRLLFVRYGNDQYLKELASDREKHHGRLRNRIKPVKVRELNDGSLELEFKVKIHTRLGTQFKLFLDVEGDVEKVKDYLNSHDNVYDVSDSLRPNKTRVFFLIRDFAETQTIEGFKNNIIWPV